MTPKMLRFHWKQGFKSMVKIITLIFLPVWIKTLQHNVCNILQHPDTNSQNNETFVKIVKNVHLNFTQPQSHLQNAFD